MNDVQLNRKLEIQYCGFQTGIINISACRQDKEQNLDGYSSVFKFQQFNEISWSAKPEVENSRWRPLNFNFGRYLAFPTFGSVKYYSNHSHRKAGTINIGLAVEISFLSCLHAEIYVCHFKFWFRSRYLDFYFRSGQTAFPMGQVMNTVFEGISNGVSHAILSAVNLVNTARRFNFVIILLSNLTSSISYCIHMFIYHHMHVWKIVV